MAAAVTPADSNKTRARWLLLGYATTFACAASAHLVWLLWRYVPIHAALFEGLGMPLPRSTELAVGAAMWLIRLLPFLILLGIPVALALVVTSVVVAPKVGVPTVVKALTGLAFLAATMVSLASVFVVHAMHAGYQEAATNEQVQENLKAFGEFQKQKKE